MAKKRILGWTPNTDRILLRPSESSHGRDGGDGDPPVDVIDHTFGAAFPPGLTLELRSNGWLRDPGGGSGEKLRPARTKADVDIENLLRDFIGPFVDNDDVRRNGGIRGDESAFISRRERMKGSFPERHPLLHHLLSIIESTAFRRLRNPSRVMTGDVSETNGADRRGASDDGTYFEFDPHLTSVQVAKYPGDGRAGYPRHCDRGEECLRGPITDPARRTALPERLLTFLYYLTPADWDPELDGGALRIFWPVGKRNDDSIDSDAHYFDITPLPDRLVVFRSDLVEHRVMPSLRRDRVAITVWLYGRAVRRLGASSEPVLSPARLSASRFGLSGGTKLGRDSSGKENHGASNPPPLPIISTDISGDETIFVAIPSYRDKDTWPTIKSLVEMACHPERVHVGVVFQVDTASWEETQRFTVASGSGTSVESSEWSQETNFRSITLDYRHATGPCYARHLAQTLHRGEDYVLQIDSHMRFRPDWDEYLIQQLNKTACPKRALLTAYPSGYEIPDGPGPDAETRATMLVPWKFGQDGMLRQRGRLLRSGYRHGVGDVNVPDNDNVPCLLYAGGFNFSCSSVMDTCPYDHKLHGLFFGEEISMAVRLYTCGIDLYAPPRAVCYHLWKRNPLRARMDDWSEKAMQREDALEVVRMQLRGLGRGLGRVRSVMQFSEELGVDFEKRILVPGCESAGLGEDAFALETSGMIVEEGMGTRNAMSEKDTSSVLRLVGRFM